MRGLCFARLVLRLPDPSPSEPAAERRRRMEVSMRIAGFVALVTLIAVPCFAQSERFYLEGTGGFNVSSIGQSASDSLTSGNFAAQGGVDVPHVKLFGEVGHFNDLHPAGTLESLDQTVATFE